MSESEKPPFAGLTLTEARWMILLKRALLLVVVFHLLIGLVSSYRAYFQVHSVEINTSEGVLSNGSTIETRVVSYGRTPVDARLEIIQDGRAITIGEQRMLPNEISFYDPRTQTLVFKVKLTWELLTRFRNGPALLRATAVGRPQWTRLPPPVIHEVTVVIQQSP